MFAFAATFSLWKSRVGASCETRVSLHGERISADNGMKHSQNGREWLLAAGRSAHLLLEEEGALLLAQAAPRWKSPDVEAEVYLVRFAQSPLPPPFAVIPLRRPLRELAK